MDFFEHYFDYVGKSEAPNCYHRWCAIATISALVGRNVHLPFGHKPIYPNQYILLVGAPGTRKNTALNISKDILTRSGYTTFGRDRSSLERFLVDMIKKISPEDDLENWNIDEPSEVTIAHGEFLDFIGQGNMDFLTLLTNLWDNLPVYEHPKLHGKSVVVYKPTVNILGGATVKGIGMAIPPEAIGTGILSRLILVHSEPTDTRITFPEEVEEEAAQRLVDHCVQMKALTGRMDRTKNAEKYLDKMYKTYPGLEDGRFQDYSARRFTHLLKLTMLMAISRLSLTMDIEDALKANTILHHTELRMNKALGEFGKSKYSDVSNTIMEYLGKQSAPASHTQLWKIVSKDLNDPKELGTIMKNLLHGEKIQVVTAVGGKQGYLPKIREHKEWDKDLLLEDYLTDEEYIR
jgi:hypothetical protein